MAKAGANDVDAIGPAHIVLPTIEEFTREVQELSTEAIRSAINGIHSYGLHSRHTLLEDSQSVDLRIPCSTSSSGDPHRDIAGVSAAQIPATDMDVPATSSEVAGLLDNKADILAKVRDVAATERRPRTKKRRKPWRR